jgi:hypothetical protein
MHGTGGSTPLRGYGRLPLHLWALTLPLQLVSVPKSLFSIYVYPIFHLFCYVMFCFASLRGSGLLNSRVAHVEIATILLQWIYCSVTMNGAGAYR